MTDDELKALVESNARAIAANGEQMKANDKATNEKINNLADVVQAFIAKIDSEGLRVTLITDVADDVAAEVVELEKDTQRHDVSIEALRADAIADRAAFREQAEADRQAAEARAENDRKEAEARAEANRREAKARDDEDRLAAKSRADADRQAFREEMAASRAENGRILDELEAQRESMRALLSALATTNGRVDNLEAAG
ncbi:MAG: hypothetical protein AAFP09_00990 [Cyanobacteria bacterium J06607_10]